MSVCISYECPKYCFCERTVHKSEIEDGVPYASYASVSLNHETGYYDEEYWCGEHGNYKYFKHLHILCEKCGEECTYDYYKTTSKHYHGDEVDTVVYILCPKCCEEAKHMSLFAFNDVMKEIKSYEH